MKDRFFVPSVVSVVVLAAVGICVANCTAAIPTPSMPCEGLYCLQWSGPPVGIPADGLVCAKTEAAARALVAPFAERHPEGSFRLVRQP